MYDCNCRWKRLENSSIDGRSDETGARRSLSQPKNLPNIIALAKKRPHDSNSSPVTLDAANITAVRPKADGQHSSQGLSNDTLSKEAASVDWKMKPELSSNKLSKENVSSPVIAAVEGGFHTQYLLFTRNDAASASAAANSAFLLKVQSNCCWDSIRGRILKIISKQCLDNTVYPPVGKLHIGGFVVEILPKSSRPEVLPPDVQKRMMSRSLHAICIRITVDHSVVNSPLCTSLATGLSAFTKLKLKFPSDKSHQSIESSQSSVQHEGSSAPQLSTSFEPFSSRPVKAVLSPVTATETVTQPASVTITCGRLETSRLQTVKPTDPSCPGPAELRSSSLSTADNSTACSIKFSLTGTDVDESRKPVTNKTECAGQPVSSAISPVTKLSASTASNRRVTLPSTSFSSAFSSFLSTNCSDSQEKMKNPLLPADRAESVRLTEHSMQSAISDASGHSQTLKVVTGSLSDIRQGLHEATLRSPVEVIVVEEDDGVLPQTSISQSLITDANAAVSSSRCTSTQFSTASSQSLVSHSSSSDAVQSIEVHDSNMSVDQSVSDVSVHSRAPVYPVSLGNVSRNSMFTAAATSVSSLSLNVASSEPVSSEQSVLMETTALGTVSSSPGHECTVVDMEQVTVCQQNEKVACPSNITEPHVTGNDFSAQISADTETAAMDVPQPLDNKTVVDSLTCSEELSSDAESHSVTGQKRVDTSQPSHDLECQSVASTSAEEVNEALPPVDCNEFKSGQHTEQASTAVIEHVQPGPAEVRCPSALSDSIVEIVPSDDVRTFCDKSRHTL